MHAPPGMPAPLYPGGPPPRSKGNPAALIVILLVGLLVVGGCGVGGVILLTGDDDDDPGRTTAGSGQLFPTSVPTPTFSVPTTRPTPPTTPRKPVVGSSFFARSVSTSKGTYLQSSSWSRSCSSSYKLKSRLATLLRQEDCKGLLYGAMYQGPNKLTYVQMTVVQFPDSSTAQRVARRVSSSTAPVIRVAYGNEPGHWWSSSSVGEYVLIRQSFNNEARYPGPRTGPAQTLGDTLIRRFQAELTNMYTWSN